MLPHRRGKRARSAPLRLIAELWPLIKNEDWALVGRNLGNWPTRLWDFKQHIRRLAVRAVAGVGYNLPLGRRCARSQGDGTSPIHTSSRTATALYAPGARGPGLPDPLLTIMNNKPRFIRKSCISRHVAVS